MSGGLRCVLIVGAVLTCAYVLSRIRKSKMKPEDSVFWLLLSAVFVLMGIFPAIPFAISDLLGFQSPVNLVFLVVIFLLLIRIFIQDMKMAKLQNQVTSLAQTYAVRMLHGSGVTESDNFVAPEPSPCNNCSSRD